MLIGGKMKFKRNIRKISVVFALLTILSLLANTTALADTTATTKASWISHDFIEVTIVFPDSISGDFAGTLGASHFDCTVINSNTLDCIGPDHWGSGQETFNIYQNTSPYNVTLLQVITVPPNPYHQNSNPPPLT
jgi:hypothetical protein